GVAVAHDAVTAGVVVVPVAVEVVGRVVVLAGCVLVLAVEVVLGDGEPWWRSNAHAPPAMIRTPTTTAAAIRLRRVASRRDRVPTDACAESPESAFRRSRVGS